MIRLSKYLKYFKKEVILGPVFKLIEAIFELIVPIIMAKIIDIGVKNADTAYIYRMGGYLLLLGIVGLGCAFVCQYFASKASQGVGTMIRNDLFQHITSLSHAEIDQIGTSSFVNRITNDINQLQLAVAMLIRLVIRAPFLVIGSTIMAMMLDIQLSWIFIVSGGIVALVLFAIMHHSIPFYRVIQKKLDRIGLLTLENLAGVRVIRAFSRQKTERQRFQDSAEDHANTAVHVGKISALLNPMTTAVMNIAIVGVLWFGGVRVNVGTLAQGEVVALVNYMTQISLALVVVANLVIIFTKASASAARVNEVFDLTSSVASIATEPVLLSDKTQPKIEFQSVSFAYGQSEVPAVDHLSFQIMPGETVGIIGVTGSGKSTLVQLIPRFYAISSGRILLDGVDIADYPLSQLRTKIGFVPQHTALFYGSIEKNLKWANPDATPEQLEHALRIAQAKEFVDQLPEGLDTILSQNAKNVSGGQKQRLTIARALTLEPDILILDDSSSALDFATDAALRKAIREETKGMTVLIVSQRANSIKHADHILVMEDGKLVGHGTHTALLAENKPYQEICRSQFSQQELEQIGGVSS